jgi:hypothetical protein
VSIGSIVYSTHQLFASVVCCQDGLQHAPASPLPLHVPLVHVLPELQLPQEPPHPSSPHVRPVQLGTQAPAQSVTGFVVDR